MTMIRPRPCLTLLLGALLAAGAGAQGARPESDAPPQDPTQVLSDVRPLPAEDRDSAGAVLDASRMGAQRDAASAPSTGNAVKPVENREISRIVDRTRSWDDVRDAASTQVPAGEASGAPAAPLPNDQEKR
jgi:hypothetical protein